jgi:hypothetical protein
MRLRLDYSHQEKDAGDQGADEDDGRRGIVLFHRFPAEVGKGIRAEHAQGERETKPKAAKAMIGPQNAIMLMIRGSTLTKLLQESGAAK